MNLNSENPGSRSSAPGTASGGGNPKASLITVVAVAAVAFAGAAALTLNLGILGAAEDSDLGTLSAAGNSTGASMVSTGQVSTAKVNPVPVAGSEDGAGQEIVAGDAGTVVVQPVDGGLRLGDVSTNAGWTWTLAQPDPATLRVSFTDGNRVLELLVAAAADGTIAAELTEPIVSNELSDRPSFPFGGDHEESDDDEYEEHEYEEHEYEEHEYEEHEYEEHEYEEHEDGDDD